MLPAEISARVGAAYQAFARGDLPSATRYLEAVLAAAPHDVSALNLFAAVKRQAGDAEGALALFDRAVAAAPAAAPILLNRANLLFELGRFQAALDGYDSALRVRAGHAETHLYRGRALAALGRHADALGAYDDAQVLQLNSAGLWSVRGVSLAALERHEEAQASFAESLRLNPCDADVWFNHGRNLHALGESAAAIAAYDSALAITPDEPGVWDNRGTALLDLDHVEPALESLHTAVRLRPQHADTHSNLGLALFAAKRPHEAVASFDRALVLIPSADAKRRSAIAYNRSMALLAQHDVVAGWTGFEARWETQLPRAAYLGRDEPKWRGETLAGPLRVWREQGIGDEILFARLLPLARARVDRLLLQCSPRLAPLFARSFDDIETVPEEGAPSAVAQCALGGLGMALQASGDHLGEGRAFLAPDPKRRDEIRARYEALAHGRRIIGIAWASKSPKRGAYKSAALAHWGALLKQDALFINLQYESDPEEVAAARRAFGADIHTDPQIDQMQDLDAFAAQIAALDHVVSVSNTTVHLAGALGVACIVMPPPARGRLWYWGLEGEKTPWYASVHVLRRELEESWDAHIARAAALLF